MRRRYAVIFERAEGNWAAYVPDLPGCITTGASLEETELNMCSPASVFDWHRLHVVDDYHIQGNRLHLYKLQPELLFNCLEQRREAALGARRICG